MEDEQFIQKALQILHTFREKTPEYMDFNYKKILKTRAHYEVKINKCKLRITLWEEKDYTFSLKWGSQRHVFNTIDECIEFLTQPNVENDMKFLREVSKFRSKETFLSYPYNKFKKTKYHYDDNDELEYASCYSKVWVINRDCTFMLRNPKLLSDTIKSNYEGDIEDLRGKTWKSKDDMKEYLSSLNQNKTE